MFPRILKYTITCINLKLEKKRKYRKAHNVYIIDRYIKCKIYIITFRASETNFYLGSNSLVTSIN